MNTSALLLLSVVTLVDQPALTGISETAPELKKEFNAATSCVRLVLIVSPG
jgi:hypothetical protein